MHASRVTFRKRCLILVVGAVIGMVSIALALTLPSLLIKGASILLAHMSAGDALLHWLRDHVTLVYGILFVGLCCAMGFVLRRVFRGLPDLLQAEVKTALMSRKAKDPSRVKR